MVIPWDDADEAWKAPPSDWLGVPRALMRFLVLFFTLLLCIIPFIILRYGQRLFGKRHGELFILKYWGAIALWCFGLRVKIEGEIKIAGGMITSNHINFIDIPLIFRVVPGYMMAKYEIKHWFFIGWCARILGTEFIKRDPAETPRQVASLKKRVAAGDRMIIFPEATTTDGQRVIPFRSSMFEAVAQLDNRCCVQPLTIYYHAPEGASQNFFGYWGEAGLVTQMWATFKSKGLKRVDVVIAEPLPAGLKRKEMAQMAEQITRDNFTKLQGAQGARLAAQ